MKTQDIKNANVEQDASDLAASTGATATAPGSVTATHAKKINRVFLPLLVFALLLIAIPTGSISYYAITHSGTSTAQIASTGTHQITTVSTPTDPVQGEVLEYSFDIEAENPETKFTYTLAISPSHDTTVDVSGVKYRLYRQQGGSETEIQTTPENLYKNEALMSFDAGSTQKHSYVLRVISNDAGTLGFDVAASALQVQA